MNSNILRQLNQRPIAYYPLYKDLTNSTTAGVILSQLMYWFSKKDKFYKTDDDLLKETHLSKNELRTAKKTLKNLNFISITREGVPAKTYYRIDWKAYELSLVNSTKLDDLNSRNSTSEINATITKTSSKKEREETFYIKNKESVLKYIENVEKTDNIKNKMAHKKALISKFMKNDGSSIEVFEEWRLEENIKILYKTFSIHTISIVVEEKKEDYKLIEIKKNNFNIVLLFQGICVKQSLYHLRIPLKTFNEAKDFLNERVKREVIQIEN